MPTNLWKVKVRDEGEAEAFEAMNDINDFADAIGLDSGWPKRNSDQHQMDLSGLLIWAEAYFSAAEKLHFEGIDRTDLAFYCGPVMQNVGLSTELALKALLRGGGKTQNELRSYSHNTYRAYCAAKKHFDEVKFINLFFANTGHIEIPDEVRNRLIKRAEKDVEQRWRVYFDHLRLLDTVYDKPFRNRYISPGPATLPETELILVGTKILLSAMRTRLAATNASHANV